LTGLEKYASFSFVSRWVSTSYGGAAARAP